MGIKKARELWLDYLFEMVKLVLLVICFMDDNPKGYPIDDINIDDSNDINDDLAKALLTMMNVLTMYTTLKVDRFDAIPQ